MNLIKYIILFGTCVSFTPNIYNNSVFNSASGSYIDYNIIGDTFIEDIDEYMYREHQNKYNRTSFYYMKGIEFFEQKNHSIYIAETSNEPILYYIEGNCTINSSYSLIYNLVRGKKMNNVPNTHFSNLSTLFNDSNFGYIINSDILYSEFGSGTETISQVVGDQVYLFTWKLRNDPEYTINSIPYGYIYLRSSAISNGYNNLGLDIQFIDDMLEYVFDLRNYNVDFALSNNFDDTQVINNIHDGIPSIINVRADDYYGSHSMMVYGYAKYVMKEQFYPSYREPEELIFYAVDNGLIQTQSEIDFIDFEGNKICWYNTFSAHSYNFVYLNQ